MKKGKERLTKAALAAIIIMAVGLLSCGNDEPLSGSVTLPADPFQQYVVCGHVYDARTGYGVPGVHLEFYDQGYIGDTYTWSGPPGSPDLGFYNFYLGEDRLNHQIWVYATKGGYYDSWTYFIYWPGPTYTHNITLRNKDGEPGESQPE